MGSRDVSQHAAAAVAWVQQAAAAQGREHRVVQTAALALAQQRSIPLQTEPAQILKRLQLSARADAGRIEIIDAQQPLSA